MSQILPPPPKSHCVHSFFAGPADLARLHISEDLLRKTSPSMQLAMCAVGELLRAYPQLDTEGMGLVVGSHLGELENTLNFLKTYYDSGLARPVLFQNSLHSSIAGFLNLQFNIRGPTTLTSFRDRTLANSLEIAHLFLQHTPFVVVVTVEYATPPLKQLMSEESFIPAAPGSQPMAIEPGCTAYLYASDTGLALLERQKWETHAGTDSFAIEESR
jgi:hypothetical protein